MQRGFVFLIPASLLIMFTGTSTAQEDLLACVDSDVREGLRIGAASRHTAVTQTVSEELIGVAEPEDFQFIGSSESPFYSVAAYRTSLMPADALEAALGMLGEAGWREFRPVGLTRGGFVTTDRPLNQSLCRDLNSVSVSSRHSNDATYVSMNFSEVPQQVSCDEMLSDSYSPFARRSASMVIHEHMPALTLPEGARTMDPRLAALGSMAGFSGSDRFLHSRVDIETDLSAQELVDHFEQQLRDQGWKSDSAWSGETSSGSVWLATPEDELNLMGLLDVIALDETVYQATFRASSLEVD